MSIFMKYEGVTGESDLNGASGFIRLHAFHWGASRSVSTMRAASRGNTEPTVQDVQVTKAMDATSVQLTHQALLGSFDREVEIHFVRTGQSGPEAFAVYKLKDCGVSSYEIAAGADGQPEERLTLNFTEIQFTFTAYSDALSGVPDSMFYTLPSATGG